MFVAVVVVDMNNVDFFVDVNELMNNLNVESKKGLVDDELNFHRFVELVLFQHYLQHMLNLQIHNADASFTLTTFNDAVTYYFRNVVVGRASFIALDKREREIEREKKRKKEEKVVGVPLAATIVPVAMADVYVTSIGRPEVFSFFFFLCIELDR